MKESSPNIPISISPPSCKTDKTKYINSYSWKDGTIGFPNNSMQNSKLLITTLSNSGSFLRTWPTDLPSTCPRQATSSYSHNLSYFFTYTYSTVCLQCIMKNSDNVLYIIPTDQFIFTSQFIFARIKVTVALIFKE